MSASPKRLQILIVEDSPQNLDTLRSNLQILGFEVVAVCSSLKEFREKCERTIYDLAIVDIRLGESNNRDGIKIVKYLQDRQRLVIVFTAYESRRVWGMAEHNMRTDFMSKPCLYPGPWRTRILTLLNRVYGAKEAVSRYILPDGRRSTTELLEEVIKPFFFRDVRLTYNGIIYIETSKGSLIFHLKRRSIRVPEAGLEAFFKECPHSNMMRVHRSFAINRNCIIKASLNRVIIELGDGSEKEIPVGKTYRDKMRAYIGL